MPSYFYTAKSFYGKTVTGTLQAKDAHELSHLLKNEGLFLVKYVSEDKKNKKWLDFNFSFGVPITEKIVLTKNLSVMVDTGLSLVKSFDILANQAKNKKLKTALFAVREQINKGESMSEALSGYPDIFSDFFLSMVKIGEESGTLEESLKVLSLQMEKEHKLKSAVQGAMIYPIIILSLMLVVGIIVAIYVLPKLKVFFTGLDYQVPWYTKMLIDFGDFSTNYWPLLIIIPIVLIASIILGLRTKGGKWFMDTTLLKLPVFSKIVKEKNCATLIRSLSSLLSSGVPLTRSLEVVSGTVSNVYFKRAIDDALEKIKRGEKLSEALGLYKDIFPFGVLEMLTVGEETGKTPNILKTLADFYEEEVSDALGKLSAIIEPVFIIVLGVVVGFFAISIIGPLYSSLGSIH